jgi:uncharacterized phage protein (TIGR01671 family)
MNRELKFRVWDVKNKKFLNPSDIAINGNGNLLITDSGWYENFENQNLSDYVVQQFTGEYDKNKKEIYEGDIIRSYSKEFINDNYEAEVVFMDAAFHSKINEKEYAGLWSGDDIEVIGNIFENPEFLK